jgi:hypothetical protein
VPTSFSAPASEGFIILRSPSFDSRPTTITRNVIVGNYGASQARRRPAPIPQLQPVPYARSLSRASAHATQRMRVGNASTPHMISTQNARAPRAHTHAHAAGTRTRSRHTLAHTRIHPLARTHARTRARTHARTHACAHAHTRTRTHAHKLVHARVHACVCPRALTYTHICTHARAQSHPLPSCASASRTVSCVRACARACARAW